MPMAVIDRAKNHLHLMKINLEDLTNTPSAQKRHAALANIITIGRSITFILQNLKSTVLGSETFLKWYTPVQESMKKDELLNFFKDARNELEKEGKLNTIINIKTEKSTDLGSKSDKPLNAKHFFLFDNLGGCGWLIENEDGTTEKIYTEIHDGVNIEILFSKPPTQHLGSKISNPTIENICNLYYEYLKSLINKAALELGIQR